jgi:flavin reductase (DIM6/NTAB) family NADH-FMN oxidoreductase RutF
MGKIRWKPGTMLYPLPAVMVSCGQQPDNYNIITIAWTGVVNSDPPIMYISVRPERHSFDIIKDTGDFVINLTNRELAYATDWNGVKSGRDFDKAKETNLTYGPSDEVQSPHIVEAPLSIECKTREIIPLGTHHMFLADVIAVQADEAFLDAQTGRFDMQKAGLITYAHGHYYELGKMIGRFGYSVMKKKTKKKIQKRNRK